MVLINDKKYACQTCIKGHRSSSCIHNDRPLYEVKKKGRPATQCLHCRQARKDRALHVKCDCAAPIPEPTRTPVDNPRPASTPSTSTAPVFPNGFRDVHAMNDAAEALHSLTRGHGGGETVEAKVRKVDALLNPCRCLSGGKCHCCRPRTQDPPSGTSTPSDIAPPPQSQTSTDKLADMFSTVSTISSSETSRIPPASAYVHRFPPMQDSSIRISDTHHPAHTSPYVHKAKLYSPYSPNVRHSSATDPTTGTSQKHHRPPVRTHASSSSSNHDSSNTLPSIRSLPTDAAARNNQLKDLVLPSIISFPTAMEITLDGCTCGENCACPGCAVHPQSTSPPKNIETGEGSHEMEGVTCPTSCTSCFDCRARVSVPAGIPTIDQLITVASSAIPLPSNHGRPSSSSNGPGSAFELDGFHTNVLPTVVLQNEAAAEAWGLNKLKPLECCNGRCQCSPGNCKCDSECCGCCSFCSCGEPDSLADVEPMQVDGASYKSPTLKDILGPLDAPAVRGGCCAVDSEGESSRRPSTVGVEAAAVIPALGPDPVARHSAFSNAESLEPELGDVDPDPTVAPPPPNPPLPKSCCSKETTDHAPSESLPPPKLPSPPTAKPRALSRSASTSKPHSTSHTPKAILPRPPGSATANPGNIVSVIQTKNGAKHQLILPTSSRTIQVEMSLHRRASGRKPSKSGAATPSGLPLAGDALPGLHAGVSAATPADDPFNNHAFDPLLPGPAAHEFTSGEATPVEGLDDGTWDLIDDGERWILPSAPPPDDLLAEFDLPGGSEH